MDLFISFILSSSYYYYYVALLFDYLLKSGWRVSVWNFNNQPFKRHLFSVMIYIGISPTITCFSFHIAYVLSFAIKIVYIFLWWLHVINKVKQLHVTMQHFVLIRCLFTGKKTGIYTVWFWLHIKEKLVCELDCCWTTSGNFGDQFYPITFFFSLLPLSQIVLLFTEQMR